MNLSDLKPGTSFVVAATSRLDLVRYRNKAFQCLAASAEGILANPTTDQAAQVLFLPWDGMTYAPAQANLSYHDLVPEREVVDVGYGTATTLGAFYPALFESAPAPTVAVGVSAQAVAVAASQFKTDRVFRVTNTTVQLMKPYVGIAYRTIAASSEGILAVPESRTKFPVVFIPIEGTTFNMDPSGQFEFRTLVPEMPLWDITREAATSLGAFFPALFPAPQAPPAPVVSDMDVSLFQTGRTFVLPNSTNNLVRPYTSSSAFQVIFADKSGVLAAPEARTGLPLLFIPFDGLTTFTLDPGVQCAFLQLRADSPVYDIPSGSRSTLSAFFPGWQATVPTQAQVTTTQQASVSVAQPVAPAVPFIDYSMELARGTIFVIASTDNYDLVAYTGIPFQSLQASSQGVLAIPEYNSGFSSAVYIPFDGLTVFTVNPSGHHRFASGVGAGSQIYNPVLDRYIIVEDFYTSYLGLLYVPSPVIIVDMPIAFIL